jgi:hypothetical protein
MAVSLGRASKRLPAYCLLSPRFRIAGFSDAIKAVAVSDAATGDYGEISPGTNLRSFCAKLAGHVAAWAEQH